MLENLFETPQLFKQSDKDYFAMGAIDIDNKESLVISNSLLKKIVKRGLFDVLTVDNDNITPELQERFNIGHAVHTRILEPIEFNSRFYVDNYPKSDDDRIQIKENDFEFMIKAMPIIQKKYPEMLDGNNAELTATFKLNGVKCKAKLDKIVQKEDGSIDIYDVKTTRQDFFNLKQKAGDRYQLRNELISLGYDLQAYFYTRAIEELLISKGGNTEVRFHFLLISTDTADVQMFTAGSGLFLSGEDKFNSVFGEIEDFVRNGKSSVCGSLLI